MSNTVTLRETQESLQAHLLADDEGISKYITGATPEMVSERLAIYNGGYYARLIDALKNDYHALCTLMTEHAFFHMGEAYAQAYPSKYFSVDLFGQHLAKFLATTKPYCEKPYLSELARFIWDLNSTIDGPNGTILKMADMAAIPQDDWADMHIKLHPCTRLVTMDWNIVPIWHALIQNNEPPAPQQEKTYAAVWRKNMSPYYCSLAEHEAWMLQALHDDKSFGEICEGLLQWFPEDQVATNAVNLLVYWLNEEMLSEVTVKQNSNL